MIAIKLEGGLGNQMFQYAFGKMLSVKYQQPLFIDLKAFNGHNKQLTPRSFELSYLNIQSVVLTEQERSNFFPGNSLARRAKLALQKRMGLYAFLYERRPGFDPAIIPHRMPATNLYAMGHWQSHHYFESVAETIKNDFAIQLDTCVRDTTLEKDLQSGMSVCLHIRRGDYVTNPGANAIHGVCGLDYYKNAVEYINQSVGQTVSYFIFSDDLPWCKEYMDWLPAKTIVQPPSPDQAVYSLHLMSLCKHFIIANSTYSWWGAWISKAAGKIVIAPRNWFSQTNSDDLQMHPKEWILM